jgi:hypothetical protein
MLIGIKTFFKRAYSGKSFFVLYYLSLEIKFAMLKLQFKIKDCKKILSGF